jgi:hypothetical protein
MARLGWVLMAAGCSAAGVFAARFLWVTAFDRAAGDPLGGTLAAAGFWGGLAAASVGAFTVAKANGSRIPPA